MKRSRFSEAQISSILKEHQAGMSASDLTLDKLILTEAAIDTGYVLRVPVFAGNPAGI